ncbi:MAG: amidohydrolase family protein [Candidatus Aminicenantes bacterium]|nr:amidohydrolase family protein [Candidatus Aminicenantes bacterium]
MKKRITLFLLVAGLTAGLIFAQAKPAKVIAIKGARIVPVVGDDIETGTIIIKDGKIEAVGRDVAIPAGAEVVEAKGLTAYPGMIDSYSFLGLQEISGVNETVDTRETGRINPQVRAIEALRYDSMHIPITLANGITAALVAPSGGLISGQSTLIKLYGWTNREMSIKASAAMQIEFPALRGGRGGFGGGMGRSGGAGAADATRLIAELKELFNKARSYDKRKAFAAKIQTVGLPGFDETSEFLLPVIKGDLPVMISVHSDRDIKAALAFVSDEKLKAVFYGVEQGWKAAEELKAANIPVIIGSTYDMPPVWEDGYDQLYRNPVLLNKAGVKIAFSSSSASVAWNLPYHAAKAAAFGLDKREALKAVTIYPAEIFGVDKMMGSLERGKAANIVLSDGDILETRTNIKKVYVDGRDCDLSNKYTELLEKYKKK